MAKKQGYKCKVALGANKIVGIGKWAFNEGAVEVNDSTEFENPFKTGEGGQMGLGSVSFDGHYDDADALGQDALRDARDDRTHVTNLRFYDDDTHYWTPDDTTSPASYVIITGFDVDSDMSKLNSVKFAGTLCGLMKRV